MLPTAWQTNRLLIEDAILSDAEAAHQCLLACEDAAALDPAFKPVPQGEIETHISRSLQKSGSESRTFQMQMLRLRSSGKVAGYWHFQKVPCPGKVVGISILLFRPEFRRSGLGRELVSSAIVHFAATQQELWARVYLANTGAIAFWASLGLLRLAKHHGAYVTSSDTQPSIILARQLHRLSADA